MTLAEEIDANLRARQQAHATCWPGGSWEERNGVLMTRLPGAPHLQSAVAVPDAADPFTTARDWYGDESFTLWLPGRPEFADADIVDDLVGMALPVDRPPEAPMLDIRPVDDAETRVAFWTVATAFGLARDTVERLFPPELLATGRGLVGFVGGVGVATCWSYPTGRVAGLYGVATSPDHRGRGFARALVARAAADASKDGIGHLILQSSAAEDVFAAMGFAVVNAYRIVAPAWMRS